MIEDLIDQILEKKSEKQVDELKKIRQFFGKNKELQNYLIEKEYKILEEKKKQEVELMLEKN